MLAETLVKLDDFDIVALDVFSNNAKSVGIGLALLDGHITVRQAFHASRLEELHQIEEHGKVEGVHDYDEAITLMNLSAGRVLSQLSKAG